MKKYLLFILLLSAAFSSCEGFLEQQPRSQVDADKMFETDQGFKDALTACYVKMKSKSLYGENLTMTRIELMAQHWDLEKSNINGVNTLIAFKDLDFKTDDSRSFFSATYSALYNVIVQANDILDNIPSKGHYIEFPATRAIIEAEALSIRAFCHFDILRMFGQMPRNPQKKVELPYAKTVGTEAIPYYGYADFKALILQDLNDAEELFAVYDPLLDYSLLEIDANTALVEDAFLSYRRFRFNLYAVKALKARFYLYCNEPEKAYACAREVIDAVAASGQQVVSLAGESDLKAKYFALPTECILALNDVGLSGALFQPNLYCLTKTHFNEMFTGRATASNNRMLEVWDGNASISTNEVFPVIKKYNQPGSEESVSAVNRATRHQVIPIIRLSEMYLIVMETGTLAEANQLYVPYMLARNEVVTGDLTQDQLDELIEGEYRREFFAEGQMFYYYKRKGAGKMLWSTIGSFTEDNYVVPIPETEIKSN